jgi:catechol 2,3-dioxygenase-like lactoylglutathione lyase family enzyme
MITGAHTLIFSSDPDADRRFFRDVLRLPAVDVGDGWLIFALPPAEVAVHPSDQNNVHELFLLCDDIGALIADMDHGGVTCTPIEDHPWGLLTRLSLPGGGKLGVYQPRHARPPSVHLE